MHRAWDGSTVEKHQTTDPKIAGLNPAAPLHKEKKIYTNRLIQDMLAKL